MPVDLFLLGAVALHPLHFIPVAEQGERLPSRDKNPQRKEADNHDRLEQLPLPRFIDLPDDRVVADVLLDRILEIDCAHASLSIARSFALRARGFRATSGSSATTGFRVRTRTAAS